MRLRRAPTVLMYHGFCRHGDSTPDPYDLYVSDLALTKQLGMLARRGWRALNLDQYLAAYEAGAGAQSFLVTIDDGMASVATVGAPIFVNRGVPAVLFVTPGLIGGHATYLPETPGEQLLDADGLRSMSEMGIEIGAHGLDHTSMKNMSDADLLRHTRDVRDQLADVTGIPPRSFAYPFGDQDERARRAVEAAGFDLAFSVYDDAGRFAISRIDVKPGDTLTALRVKLLPGYRGAWRATSSVKPLRRAIRQLTWRR